jgi:hypothetical protein
MKSQRHALADRGLDAYMSPPEATWGLLAAEHKHMPLRIWEPACGDGAMVRPLRAAGFKVFASDIVDRGCPDLFLPNVDFLKEKAAPDWCGGIITNPPYADAEAFIDKALSFVPYAAFLLRLAFLESEKRRPSFGCWPLAAVHVFSSRLPRMHREGWDGPRTTSGVAYAWFVFDKRRAGHARIGWVSQAMIAEGSRMVGGLQ